MKKSMTDYLYALSENSYDDLYDIMSKKYRKFIRIYWLLKDYSDNIIMLKYKEKSESDKLKISVTSICNPRAIAIMTFCVGDC